MRLAGLMLLVMALDIAAPAQDMADPGTVAVIRELEKQWTTGHASNDNRSLALIFDNALVYLEYGHLVSKGEYLSRIKTQASSLDRITMESSDVRLRGRTALVVGIYRETQVRSGKSTVRRWRFVDTWVYKTSGWVLIAAGAAPIEN
ncbi:MAG TPA: nuclear transport factor 2 family protein [Candidatus Sulfotelmatobacter sp.]|nr:nuclear transport factor 2 family protein [Candidatus Sulfotelmatobacter sp.]